jgi:DNA-directed RNA polymerase specialized sigma24 family protein
MSSIGSVTKLIALARNRQPLAAQRLWDRFAARLLALARANLPRQPLALADEEDVVVSALGSFFAGVEEGKFNRLTDREALWRLLTTITKRKAQDVEAHESCDKRGCGQRPRSLGVLGKGLSGESALIDPQPPPDLQALMADECRRLLDALGDPQLCSIALWKMEGYTDEEIATRLGCTVRTVQRKLLLIRNIWSRESRT